MMAAAVEAAKRKAAAAAAAVNSVAKVSSKPGAAASGGSGSERKSGGKAKAGGGKAAGKGKGHGASAVGSTGVSADRREALLARVYTVSATRRLARGAGTYGISEKTLPPALRKHMEPLIGRVVRAAAGRCRLARRVTISARDVSAGLAASGIRTAGLP